MVGKSTVIHHEICMTKKTKKLCQIGKKAFFSCVLRKTLQAANKAFKQRTGWASTSTLTEPQLLDGMTTMSPKVLLRPHCSRRCRRHQVRGSANQTLPGELVTKTVHTMHHKVTCVYQRGPNGLYAATSSLQRHWVMLKKSFSDSFLRATVIKAAVCESQAERK